MRAVFLIGLGLPLLTAAWTEADARRTVLSALDDARIAASRPVGATGVFSPVAGGRTLSFEPGPDGGIRDRETGTQWNILGHAVRGRLAGQRLRPIAHVDGFWFAWAAFHPTMSLRTEP